MEISAGIKIIVDEDINIKDRITLSNGTNPANELTTNNQKKYVEKAFKPKKPWRMATLKELDILTTFNDIDDFSNTISLQSIPNNIVELAQKIGLPDAQSSTELENIFSNQKDSLKQLYSFVNDYVSRLLYPEHTMTYHGFCINEPHIETVSRENTSSKYMGLHIDTSVKTFDTNKANLCPNRIAINFSKEKRYLLFVNKTVDQLAEMILSKELIIEINQLDALDLVHHFFRLYPNYPVVRVAQHPFEAYIAPTDNIIHDGSTDGNTKHDITLIIRGYLNPFLLKSNLVY